ncbi:MAG: type 1 glutamine amidotransferase domain-containing protein [Vicinamibacterales bacterium]
MKKARAGNDRLEGVRVAALVASGFEEIELEEPKRALERAGATVDVVSPLPGTVRAWRRTEWGDEWKVDRALADVGARDYDAVLLPGGVMNPDHLRTDATAVRFLRQSFEDGKPIGVICHGPWTLIDAGVADGLRITSYASLRRDLENAGAHWVDAEVVVDRGVVSSRTPDDLAAFNRQIVETFAEGARPREVAS